MPRLQGLPQRLPDAHRHGGLQGRVPVALLREDVCGRCRAADGTHRRMGAARLAVPWLRECAFRHRFKRVAGIAAERSLPKFADGPSARTLRPEGSGASASSCSTTPSTTISARQTRARRRRSVLEARRLRGRAAARARVLRAAVLRLRHARARQVALARVLDALAPQLERDVPVVVLEPGCLSVFRDELKPALPERRARRAAREASSRFAEFLLRRDFRPKVAGEGAGPRALPSEGALGDEDDVALLRRPAPSVARPTPAAAACRARSATARSSTRHRGGSPGLALLPALAAAPRAEVVASGFSCREQIEGLGARPTLHLAELLAG